MKFEEKYRWYIYGRYYSTDWILIYSYSTNRFLKELSYELRGPI